MDAAGLTLTGRTPKLRRLPSRHLRLYRNRSGPAERERRQLVGDHDQEPRPVEGTQEATMTHSADNAVRSLGCFLHPSRGFEPRRLEDRCPSCGRPYGFPLTSYPSRIRDFAISRPLSRGFYGAIYVASAGPFGRQSVLKVIPTQVYSFHKKDFAAECHLHDLVATGTEHVVDIRDYFQEDVTFGDVTLRSHVAVLGYVDGTELDLFLSDSANVSARTLAQLAIDIFRLLRTLEAKNVYHNDLHHRNLLVQALPRSQYRPEALDEAVRLVAVDLGSLADGSRSGPPRQTLGDLTSAASFLVEFATPLLTNPDHTTDGDYRLASALVELAALITGDAANVRTPDYEDFITQIREAYSEASSPWRPPAGLQRLNDAYNAQTLHPYFVPKLLVDPDDEWLAAVSAGGPQVITGVRGCGKTMLLRNLEFHARLSAHRDAVARGRSVADMVQKDGYVGLYLSARRLLDALGTRDRRGEALHEPYARLLVGYAREGVRACRHLHETDAASVSQKWWQLIGKAVTEMIANADDAAIANAVSPEVLERRLLAMLFSLDRGEPQHRLMANPAIALPALADAVRRASPVWGGNKVLFLLDDVSTRHLEERSIVELLGTLLFNDDRCAFKITTEGQTLELALRSAGLVEKAQPDRDYQSFDLAARVNERLKHPRKGKEFLSKILELRAAQYSKHPGAKPSELLGDVPLERVARHIVETDRTAAERKTTYWGLSVLCAICVGDVGDVLNIYEAMLRKADNSTGAGGIPPKVQNEAFQEYSSRRLYHLNRRNGELKDYAIAFAEAAHDLLQRSAAERRGSERVGAGQRRKGRLRQYAQVYVRVTTGDEDAQFAKLRELIDAGVFVLESGADAPRKKTRDADPISQFILTYRKLFGLTQYIGLAFSDRFELSGAQLERWLCEPDRGKEILMATLGGPLRGERGPARETPHRRGDASKGRVRPASQMRLIPSGGDAVSIASTEGTGGDRTERGWNTLRGRVPTARRIEDVGEVSGMGRTVVLGLGFEARCLESTRRLFGALGRVERTVMVSYPEKGFANEVEEIADAYSGNLVTVEYGHLGSAALDLGLGPVVIDVTGLAKPGIFHAIRGALFSGQRCVVVHTHAGVHYPRDEDIADVFAAVEGGEAFELLERAGKIWSGERTPYSFVPLLDADVDDSRRCLLCAAASAKHERLLSLMDERDYDAVDVVVPQGDNGRAMLARLAADVAVRDIELSRISSLDSNDLPGALGFLAERFRTYYLDGGFGIELGLTGSKMHAVACAVAAVAFKLAQVWYVSPESFDRERFTQGVGETRWYQVTPAPAVGGRGMGEDER